MTIHSIPCPLYALPDDAHLFKMEVLPVQDELSFKGVVFNEMKGVYSSPDSMNSRATQHALFPDNTYGDDSGGDPAAIPDLNFEECAPKPQPLGSSV